MITRKSDDVVKTGNWNQVQIAIVDPSFNASKGSHVRILINSDIEMLVGDTHVRVIQLSVMAQSIKPGSSLTHWEAVFQHELTSCKENRPQNALELPLSIIAKKYV